VAKNRPGRVRPCRIIDATRSSREHYLQSYRQLPKPVADVQDEAGKAGPWDQVTTRATAQPDFTRDIADVLTVEQRLG
jgi:hypothetical protein